MNEKEIIKSDPIHENLLRGLRGDGKPIKETEEITRAFLILIGEKEAASAVCRFFFKYLVFSVFFSPLEVINVENLKVPIEKWRFCYVYFLSIKLFFLFFKIERRTYNIK